MLINGSSSLNKKKLSLYIKIFLLLLPLFIYLYEVNFWLTFEFYRLWHTLTANCRLKRRHRTCVVQHHKMPTKIARNFQAYTRYFFHPFLHHVRAAARRARLLMYSQIQTNKKCMRIQHIYVYPKNIYAYINKNARKAKRKTWKINFKIIMHLLAERTCTSIARVHKNVEEKTTRCAAAAGTRIQ